MLRTLPFPVTAAAELIRDTGTLATPLLVICLTAYGDEFFGNEEEGIPPMDPLELYARLEEDFRATLPVPGENRLNAIRLALETDAFYEDPLAFASITRALNTGDLGEMPEGFVDDVELPEALWATYEISTLRDDDIRLAPVVLNLFDEAAKQDVYDEPEGVPVEDYVRDQKRELASQLQMLGLQLPIRDLI